MKLLVLLFGFLVMPWPAMADPLVWKTEKELPVSKQLPGCDPDKDENCGDSVAYVDQSVYGVKEYRTYFEAVRVQIGFGSKPNAATMMTTDELHEGAYDWGGVEQGGVFSPRVVIKRFYVFDEGKGAVDRTKTQLLAFRLKADGTSCGVPLEGIVTDNAKARAMVEQLLQRPEC
jgi:hypothetical protein